MRDLNELYGPRTDEEKQEAFALSTLKIVLRQLGWDKHMLDTAEREQGPQFGWDWFNEERMLHCTVSSFRVFEYDIDGLFLSPHGHPVVRAFLDQRQEYADYQLPHSAIFKVAELGRMVISDWDPAVSAIRPVVSGERLWVAPIKHHFKSED